MFTRKNKNLAMGAAVLMASVSMGVQTVSAEDITITYSDWQLAQEGWGNSLRTAIAEFEELNPGITVATEPVQLGQRDVRFTTAIRAGQGPDVFALDANPVRQYISAGWVLDLTPFAEAQDPAFFDDFYETSLAPVTVDGAVYGVPMNTVAMGLVYNQAMFEAAGITEPATSWEEFSAHAEALTDTSAGQWATTLVLAPAGFDLRAPSIFHSFGASFLTEDWSASALDTPEMQAAFSYVVDMIQSGVVPPGVTQVDANGARRLLANGQIAMTIGTTWTIPEVSTMNPDLDGWNTLRIAPLPTDGGQEISPHTTLYQKSIFINANTEHPEASWALVDFQPKRAQMERWFDDNNMLSSRRSVNESYGPIQESPFASVVSEEIQHGTFLPLIPEWPRILDSFRQNLQDAVTGIKTAEQALADAHAETNEILGN